MKLRDKYNSLADSQKALIRMLGAVLGIILVFVIIILVSSIVKGGKVSYEQLENIMEQSAKNYVKNDSSVIQTELYGTTTISVDTLAEKRYMKTLDKYLGKDNSCTASINVYRNLDEYDYITKLDCGDKYKSTSLVETITNENNIVTTGGGLYKENNSYVYRGEYVENYATFSGETWRIISIDENGYIKMIQADTNNYSSWDNRYNKDVSYNSGINKFEGIEASRIKDSIMSLYNDSSIIKKEDKNKVVPREYCVGKRSKNDNTKDSSSECSTKSELMAVSLITVSDYLKASLDTECISTTSKGCVNYNYLAKLSGAYWTVTAQSENTSYAYYISSTINTSQTSSSYKVRLVVTVNGDIKYNGGNGTKQDPYKIK